MSPTTPTPTTTTPEPTVYRCTNDRYCPDLEAFDSLEAFLDMCADCFGAAPALTELPDGRVVDTAGAVVLVAVRS